MHEEELNEILIAFFGVETMMRIMIIFLTIMMIEGETTTNVILMIITLMTQSSKQRRQPCLNGVQLEHQNFHAH